MTTAFALPDAHSRPAQAMEAQPHGHGIASPVGAIHQSQGNDAGAHPHTRSPLVDRRGGGQEKSAAQLHPPLLIQVPYAEIERELVSLPERVYNPDYLRNPVPGEMFVPNAY